MRIKRTRFHIGLRTMKTVAAVILSMVVVDAYGATASKLIFAMLGAMAAVQPTFRASVESSLTQIVGVLFGGLVGVLLNAIPLPYLVATGIGIVLVITLYNALGIRFSPSLPCFIVVMLCTTPDVQPIAYALGRIWDTAIGLAVGMLINTLIFPYDNRLQIRETLVSLDQEVIRFLEDMFDGDDLLPDADDLAQKAEDINRQLSVFEKQRFLMRPKHYRSELASYRGYEEKARQLVAHMEVLSQIGQPGRLSEENLRRLREDGADISASAGADASNERDVVTNYHVDKVLSLRAELLAELRQK